MNREGIEVQAAGHCFTIAETTQNFTNANIRIFVKDWVVSVVVKRRPDRLVFGFQSVQSNPTYNRM